ncbi:hypothetical protein JCM10908_000893 [Rhodotorula pacifica]|uniref:mitochondrial 54S ribosomal protein bL17m MRPL8 n=1 Tax=Rhodotorula pacifica TaxID=1495444 RepID=UPI00317068DE
MRHGLKLAKLSRPTAHRVLMLRNLVSSLLEHEQVTTTLPKAKAAQKLADQVISWGKQGGKENWERANGFLLNGSKTLKPLFETFAKRYATRPGGYTRVQRAGFRVGDRAPLAVLELVDNVNDLRFENAARTVGREMALRAREQGAQNGPRGWKEFRARVEGQGPERIGELVGQAPELGKVTRQNVVKALRYREAPVIVTEDSVTSTSELSPADPAETPETDFISTPHPPSLQTTHPALLFLDRAYHHYLATLASFTLSTASVPDPLRPLRQLSARLRETEANMERKGAPRPVVTVPRTGRVPKAGQSTAGWAATEELDQQVQNEILARGGPISRAKGAFGREARKERSKTGRNGQVEASPDVAASDAAALA